MKIINSNGEEEERLREWCRYFNMTDEETNKILNMFIGDNNENIDE